MSKLRQEYYLMEGYLFENICSTLYSYGKPYPLHICYFQNGRIPGAPVKVYRFIANSYKKC